jgi:glycine/D-amino acid oxidase-like deaminating enzyme
VNKKHVVILGAGFAGLELATRLSESLADEVRVTLLDQNDSFSFGFSKLDVLFGRNARADVLLHYGDISREGIEFRQERVTSIDPEKRRVTTDDGSYDADVLAVALGADYDMAATQDSRRAGSSTTRSPAPSDCATSSPTSIQGRSSSGSSVTPSSARPLRSRARSCCTITLSSGGSEPPQKYR